MKKFTKLTSLLLAVVIALGCVGFGAFAEDGALPAADAQDTEEPTANGIVPLDQMSSLEGISAYKGYGFASTAKLGALGNGYDYIGMTSIKDVDGDYYLRISKNTKSDTAASKDAYMDIWNNASVDLSGRDAIKKNVKEEHLGASFVLSVDLKAENNANAQEISVFNLRSSACESGSVSATLLKLVNSNGSFAVQYREATSSSTSYLTVSEYALPTEKFDTVALFVTPMTNSYNVYINGEPVAKDIRFLTDDNAASLTLEAANITAQYNDDGSTASYKNYVFSLCRMFYKSVAANGTTYESSDANALIGVDNIKFYYADHYAECSSHSFQASDEHTHDAQTGTPIAVAECENCTLTYTKQIAFDTNGDSICDACVAENVPSASGISSIASLKSNESITSIKADDFSSTVKTGWGPNGTEGLRYNNSGFAMETEASGNSYVKVGGNTESEDNYITLSTAPNPTSLDGRNRIQSMIADGSYTDYAGRPFTISLDLKVEDHTKVIENTSILRLGSYTTASGTANHTYLLTAAVKENESGERRAYLAYSVANSSTPTVSDYEFSSEGFETVSVYVDPAENYYNIYVDGVLLIEKITFLSASDITALKLYSDEAAATVTDESGNEITGGSAYILGYARLFQINNAIHGSGNYSFGLDNAKVYYADKFVECAEHSFTLDSALNANNGHIELGYVCNCGAGYGVMAQGVVLNGDSVILGRSASLGENIGFKLYADYGTETLADAAAKLVIAVNGEDIAEYPLTSMTKENGRYVTEIPLTSVDMAATVSARLITSAGESAVYQTSFEAYAEALLAASADAELTALLNATLNYGAYAQDYFTSKNGTSFDAAPDKLLQSELEAITTELETYTVTASGSGAVEVYGASLVLESKTTVKVFFTGGVSATVDGEAAEIRTSGSYSYVEIDDLMPYELDKSVAVVISDGTDSVTVNVSVLACANLVVNNSSFPTEFKELAKAIYLYNKAADAYVE